MVLTLASSLAFGCLLLPVAAEALEIDGRYIGTISRTDLTGTRIFGNQSIDLMHHNLDMWTRGTTPGGMDLRLRTFLRYTSELGVEDGDLFTYRFMGELIANTWRLEGQFAPYQAVTPGPDPAKERAAYLNVRIIPPRYPQLFAEWRHRERETGLGPSANDDRRAEVSYGNEHASGYVGVRRIDADDRRLHGVDRSTDEFRAGIQGRLLVQRAVLNGSYDWLSNDTRSLERRSNQDIHRLSASASYRPLPPVSLFASGLQSWRTVDDNALPSPIDYDETFLSAGVQYTPVPPLSLSVARDYQQSLRSDGRVVSDYLRVDAGYRDEIWRQVEFLAGFRRVQRLGDLDGDNPGSIPTNSIFASLDGLIMRGISGRAETSYQWGSEGERARELSRQLLQLRTVPVPSTRFDVTWTRITQPSFGGLEPLSHQWEFLLGYTPTPSFSFIGSHRRETSEGIVDRLDRLTSLDASWQSSESITIAANWQHRRTGIRDLEISEKQSGIDLRFWLPGDFRLLLSSQWVRQERGPESSYYSANLQKDF